MLLIVALLLCLPVLCGAAYLALMTLASGTPRQLAPMAIRSRFVVLVPAHDEGQGIVATVQSIRAIDYPPELWQVVVIADNCSDDTAARAEAAGATVWLREDAQRRGKGYALEFAFERVRAQRSADAVVVIDADTRVSANLLQAFDLRLQHGALALQAYYGVSNPLASWRTRLVTIALAVQHRLRGRARECWRTSAGLKGNGMAFALTTLARVPHTAYSLVEDLEYGIRLARAGIRVVYVDEAEVLGEMVSSGQAAQSQRQRWEGGRSAMVRQHALRLLSDGCRFRDRVRIDLALDLLMPPLAQYVMALLLVLTLCAAGAWWHWLPMWVPALPLLCCGVLLVYVARGAQLSGLGVVAFTALLGAPFFIVWKLWNKVFGRRREGWVRTQREAAAGSQRREPDDGAPRA